MVCTQIGNFDKCGNRLGRGAGAYDSFLRHAEGLKCGVCHDWRLLDNLLPTEEHDIQMDLLVTTKRTLKFSR